MFDAVCLRLAAAVEEIEQLDDALRHEAFGDDWVLIKATRNAIAHNYAFVDDQLISDTIDHDVREFEKQLRALKLELESG